jgi:hypothetical protein
MQAALGLEADGCSRRVVFSAPRLPDGLEELSIDGLAVRDDRVDLRVFRQGGRVDVNVLSRDCPVEVAV